jgi:hypothetical protein
LILHERIERLAAVTKYDMYRTVGHDKQLIVSNVVLANVQVEGMKLIRFKSEFLVTFLYCNRLTVISVDFPVRLWSPVADPGW